MIKRILEQLETVGWIFADYYPDETAIHRETKKYILYDEVVKIVQEAAKEYSNEWIPVETEMPKERLWAGNMKSHEVFVTYLDNDGIARVATDNTYDGKWYYFGNRVIAWMPRTAPAPYRKGE